MIENKDGYNPPFFISQAVIFTNTLYSEDLEVFVNLCRNYRKEHARRQRGTKTTC